MLTSLAFIAAGIALLWLGAEWLVGGGARLALRLGATPLVAGLTIVAFGTSAPELVVSIKSAIAGQPDIAVGNVIGSNIFNITVILAVASLIRPAKVCSQMIRREIPILIAVTPIPWLMLLDGRLGRADAALLLATLATYASLTVRRALSKGDPPLDAEFSAEIGRPANPARLLGLIAAGILLLVIGGQAFLAGAVRLAQGFGLSDAVTGITIVAAGTSLPELAASTVASLRGRDDIAVGNIVGSNLFNILGILGATAAIRPAFVAGIGTLDLVVMLVVTVALFPLARSEMRLSRPEALLLLAGYCTYTTHLITRNLAP